MIAAGEPRVTPVPRGKPAGAPPWFVEALLDPGVYPHRVDRVELVETHISWVFLAGERVYKVKKPVELGFLDFSTLARRRRFCREEVRLNRRLAAETYLGRGRASRVAGRGSRSAARAHRRGGGGDATASRRSHARPLVTDGRARPEDVRAVAAVIARFHAAAETGGEIDLMGRVEVVRANWDENFAQTADVPPEILPPESRRAIREYVDRFLENEVPRLEGRIAEGRIRDCHGDLQAQHVCCIEPLQIFDCIEFNHRFRFGDTAAEIAFLAMDLERLGAPALAVEFLNAYLEETGDYGAVALLDFYRAYRAFVSAKVLAFQVPERPEQGPPARDLFALAGRFARPREPGRILLLSGVMGSGKSTVGRHVAARLGAIVVRTDAVRKRLAGVGLRERGQDSFGAGLYTPEMSRRTYEETLRLAGEIARAGWPVIVDGSFSRKSERDEVRALADRARRGARDDLVRRARPRHCRAARAPRRGCRRGLGRARRATRRAPGALRGAGGRAPRRPRRY